jgi:hypothetical protein
MEALKVMTRTDLDGKLQLILPSAYRGQEVEVTVEMRPGPTSLEEYIAAHQQWVEHTYGSLADDPIERGEQPPIPELCLEDWETGT